MPVPKTETVRENGPQPTGEYEPNSEWGQFLKAWKVFGGDYNFVSHPETPVVSPFDRPNPPIEDKRQYTVTQIPEGLETEDAFLERYRKTDAILITCMDKDASGPAYEILKKGGKKIMFVSIAGGITQLTQEREHALTTILSYLGKKGDHIQEVLATNHDETCGYIKASLDNPLSEALGVEVGSKEEGTATKALILHHMEKVGINNFFPQKVKPALVDIKRETEDAEFDYDFSGVQPQSLEEIVAGK